HILNFSKLGSGDYFLTDGEIEFEIVNGNLFKINRLEFTFLGGRFLATPFTWEPAHPKVIFASACAGLDWADVTQNFPQLEVEAVGLLDGVVSFQIERNTITPLPGYLQLRDGTTGKCHFRKQGWLAGEMDTGDLNYKINSSVETAFNNFDVETL